MSRAFRFTKSSTYYARHRALPVVTTHEDGTTSISDEPLDCLVTRWGYQRSVYRKPTDAYYSTSTHAWYRIACHVAVERDGDGNPTRYVHAFERIRAARLLDRYPAHTEARGDVPPEAIVDVRDGETVRVTYADGVAIADEHDGADYVEELLQLNKAKRRSPRKAA